MQCPWLQGWEVRATLHIYTQTPCGFLEVGTAFSSCLGDPIMRRLLPGLAAPVRQRQRERGKEGDMDSKRWHRNEQIQGDVDRKTRMFKLETDGQTQSEEERKQQSINNHKQTALISLRWTQTQLFHSMTFKFSSRYNIMKGFEQNKLAFFSTK